MAKKNKMKKPHFGSIRYIDYKLLTAELKEAYNKNDLNWFLNYYNKYRCMQLIQYWKKRYRITKNSKYIKGQKYLEFVFEQVKSLEKWQNYLNEGKEAIKKEIFEEIEINS